MDRATAPAGSIMYALGGHFSTGLNFIYIIV